jgi:hypothetical protein
MEAENIALKVQLTQYYYANCALAEEVRAKQAEIDNLARRLGWVLQQNKKAESAMRSACMIMPTSLAEIEHQFK